MKPFHAGDRVKLTDRFARTLLKRGTYRKPSKVDWLNRQGVIRSANHATAFVIWEGCSAVDPLPVAAIEMVT